MFENLIFFFQCVVLDKCYDAVTFDIGGDMEEGSENTPLADGAVHEEEDGFLCWQVCLCGALWFTQNLDSADVMGPGNSDWRYSYLQTGRQQEASLFPLVLKN